MSRVTRFEVTGSWWENISGHGLVFFATQPERYDSVGVARDSAGRLVEMIKATNPAASQVEANITQIEFVETDGTLRELYRNPNAIPAAARAALPEEAS